MNREELQMLLMPYADGELDAATTQTVEASLVAHPELQGELTALRDLGVFARIGFEAPVADVNLDGVFAGVMARLGDEAPGAVKQPGMGARVGTWLQGFFAFERPMALAGFAAAVVAVVGYVALSGGGSQQTTLPQNVADQGTPGNMRRGAEPEMKPDGQRDVLVRYVEVEPGGFVKIDDAGKEGDKPLVLWHVIDGEGVSIPEETGL